jgi:8-oxo-dGTP pyrophosphatase MutT (NUDIX family)
MSRSLFRVVVHVLVLREGSDGREELFLLRRAGTGFMDGYFALPGGHQEEGEGVAAAALRECREETGITPLDLEPVSVLPYRSGRHQGLNFLFQTRDYDGEPRITEPELFDCAVWAAADALPEPVAVWLPPALELRAAGVWFREFEWD